MNLLLTRCRQQTQWLHKRGAEPGHRSQVTQTVRPWPLHVAMGTDTAHGHAPGTRPEPTARDNGRRRAGPGSGTALGLQASRPLRGEPI